MGKTVFAKALESLLDETKIFSRKEWADILGFSESHIEEWVSGTLFPSPGILRMIVDVVEISFGAEQKPLDEFKKLYGKRLLEQEKNFPVQTIVHFLSYLDDLRLGEYLLLPVLDGFLRNLKTLPLDLQEQLLFHFAEACRLHMCAQKPVSLEDAEKALARLAEINGVSVEKMRKRMKKISKDALQEMNTLESLTNEEIINHINAHQKNEMLHPLTCGISSLHALLEPKEENGKVILVCPTCGHKQINWPTIVLGI